MPQTRSAKKLLKILTYVLGHSPDEFGLLPDPEGFIKVKDLLKAVSEDSEWKNLRARQISEIFLTVSNPPLEIVDNKIRTKDRERLFVPKKAENPPKLLFVCVRKKAHAHVTNKGIWPSGYRYVILSSSKKMAKRIGKRSDRDPVLLTVLTKNSIDEGVVFYQAGKTLFTASYIPSTCFTGPPLPKEKEMPKHQKPESEVGKAKSSGSYLVDLKHMEQSREKLKLKSKREKTLRKKSIKRARKQKNRWPE